MCAPADPRFANIQTDPKFRLPSTNRTHVRIDKRFAHMLRDGDFSSKARVDRYGRKLPKDENNGLGRFYNVEDEEPEQTIQARVKHANRNGEEIAKGEKKDEELGRDKLPSKQHQPVQAKSHDPARDGGFSQSSSDEESSDEESVEEEEAEELDYAQHQAAEIPVGEVTSRLAVVNLDWDNIRAADLLAVFSSFLPRGGSIRRVAIYPSQFGKERMEREDVEGPPKELFRDGDPFRGQAQPKEAGHVSSKGNRLDEEIDEDDENRNDLEIDGEQEDEDDTGSEEDQDEEDEKIKKSLQMGDEGAEFDQTHLRRYQLERLRYFYAVLTCSAPDVAREIYNSVDGTEFLSTANFFDLRFIPDEMDFAGDKPRDECERIPENYKPTDFVTDALRQSRVKLTWDADDVTRKEVQKRAFRGSRADIEANDLKAYLGSDTSDDEAPVPGPIIVDSTKDTKPSAPQSSEPASNLSKKNIERKRMRSLLGLNNEPFPRPANRDENTPMGDMVITFSSGLSESKGPVIENEPVVEETTAERYQRKEKERKARRKEKSKASREGLEVRNDADDNMEMAQATEELGFEDPFFTAPAEDRVATKAARTEAKRLKRAERAAEEAASSAQRAELELLMVDEDGSHSDVRHFDMNAIAKAEKALKKKKTKNVSTRVKEALAAKTKDNFRINVDDPRFGAVYEDSTFALDPNHPRFKGTEGMEQLLKEGRKKRGVGDDGEEISIRKKAKRNEEHEDSVDLTHLVERVKVKTKRM